MKKVVLLSLAVLTGILFLSACDKKNPRSPSPANPSLSTSLSSTMLQISPASVGQMALGQSVDLTANASGDDLVVWSVDPQDLGSFSTSTIQGGQSVTFTPLKSGSGIIFAESNGIISQMSVKVGSVDVQSVQIISKASTPGRHHLTAQAYNQNGIPVDNAKVKYKWTCSDGNLSYVGDHYPYWSPLGTSYTAPNPGINVAYWLIPDNQSQTIYNGQETIKVEVLNLDGTSANVEATTQISYCSVPSPFYLYKNGFLNVIPNYSIPDVIEVWGAEISFAMATPFEYNDPQRGKVLKYQYLGNSNVPDAVIGSFWGNAPAFKMSQVLPEYNFSALYFTARTDDPAGYDLVIQYGDGGPGGYFANPIRKTVHITNQWQEYSITFPSVQWTQYPFVIIFEDKPKRITPPWDKVIYEKSPAIPAVYIDNIYLKW